MLSLQVATLTEELENSRGGVRDQLKEKDAKINSLIEELGNSQAMLNDKVAELAEVLLQLLYWGNPMPMATMCIMFSLIVKSHLGCMARCNQAFVPALLVMYMVVPSALLAATRILWQHLMGCCDADLQ